MEVTIEQLMYGNFIKYDQMQTLTQQAVEYFVNNGFPQAADANTINIYIDMYSMLRSLYATRSKDYDVVTNVVIAASFINLCAHIRAYYRTRHRVETRIYLVYSQNQGFVPQKFYYDYQYKWNKTLKDRTDINNLISSNLGLLETLCPYLNDIFFINTTTEPAVVIYDRINKDEILYPGIPNFIFTKDQFMYQIPAVKANTVVFRVSKKEKDDSSFLVSYSNAIYSLMENINPSSNTLTLANSISPGLTSLFMAMTHVPSRDMKSAYNSNKAVSVLYNLISNKHILNGYNFYSSLQRVQDKIQPNLQSRTGPEFNILSRFAAIDVIYQHALYMNTPESKDEHYLVRKIDNDGVREINNKYFKAVPLDLNRL